MGLFKMFGAGGGKLDVVLDSPQFAAGTAISGVAKFIGGKRDQVIDALTLGVSCTLYTTEQTPNGPRKKSTVQQIVPKTTLATGVTSQAGGLLEFRFSYPLNPSVYSSKPGEVEYRLFASADIDGEVDPGDNEVFTVINGAHYDAGVMKVTGHVVGQVQVGEKVLAVWTDGNWYPGKVTNIQDGYVGVDWEDPKLGQSSWVEPAKVRPAAAGVPASASGSVQHASAPDQAAQAAQAAKAKAKADAEKFKAGQQVVAMWTDGTWHPGMITGFQNGYYGVDWTNPKLGQSTWVLPDNIKPSGKAAAPAGPQAKAMHAAKGAPMAAKAAMAAKGAAAAPAKGMPMKGGAYNKGQAIWAQFTDGSWQPATYVELRDGWHGVDWVDPKLGQSSWVQDGQIKPR